ncbi:MAG TPA: hypothetical protein VMZ52_09010 [Bryobacteraceae bacterium]|nr:hypothetical protein [Bryobacteraceae bacterium]
MPRHIVEISDEVGTSFRLLVDIGRVGLGAASSTRGTWRAVDKGAIRYNSGTAKYFSSTQMGGGTDVDQDYYLALYSSPQAVGWGIMLNEYAGRVLVNDDGMGRLAQQYCITLKPGRISWVLAD